MDAVDVLCNDEAVTVLGELLDAGLTVWVRPIDGVERFGVEGAVEERVSLEQCEVIARQREALIALVRWITDGRPDPSR